MKNILLLTTKYSQEKNNQWLTNELTLEFSKNNYEVYVIFLSWNKKEKIELIKEEKINVLKIGLPQFCYKNLVLKLIFSQLYVLYGYFKYLRKIKIKFLITSTPAFIFFLIIVYLKKICKVYSYIIIWDFYPYCLIGTKILNKNYREIIKKIEMITFKYFNYFGCMTEKNIEFLKKNYNIKNCIEILPIWGNDIEKSQLLELEKDLLREKYKINRKDITLLYGGAFSEIQGLEKIILLGKKLESDSRIKILMIGQGSEKKKIEEIVDKEKIKNIKIFNMIPKKEYEKLVSIVDFGLVCIKTDIIVPCFPSKTLDYLKYGVPIIGLLNYENDYLNILETNSIGFGIEGEEIDKLVIEIKNLTKDKINKMKENTKLYYKKYLSVQNAYKIISKHFDRRI